MHSFARWKLCFIYTACVLKTLPRLFGGGCQINQIKMLDRGLANMNHINGTTSYSRRLKNNMPASHSQQCDTSLQRWHLLRFFSLARHQQTITFVSSQSLAVKPGYRQSVWCCILRNIILQSAKHKVMGLPAQSRRDDVTVGISLNPSWLGYIIFSTLYKVIPHCYLWPTKI